MTLEKIVKEDRLVIKREGIIYTNFESIRGINPLSVEIIDGSPVQKTCVKYISSREIPERGKTYGEFIFYGELPFDIEGWEFIFSEEYPKKDETDIPVKQYLDVFGPNLNWKSFKFPEKNL